MSRHVVLTQFEAASSLISFEPGVFENFTFESAINKMIETEQKLWSAKGTIFESVNVLLKKRQPCQNWVLVVYIY